MEPDLSACQAGKEPLFAFLQVWGGYSTDTGPYHMVGVRADGKVTEIAYSLAADNGGFARNGTGSINLTDARLNSMTTGSVKGFLASVGRWTEKHDYEVTKAIRHAAPMDDFERLCKNVLDDFFELEGSYSGSFADGPGTSVLISTRDATYRVSSTDDAAPPNYAGIRDRIFAMAEK